VPLGIYSLVSPVFLVLCLALLVAQFKLPRRLAFAPLLIAAAHFQFMPVIEVGAAFDTVKLVILAGVLRAWRDNLLVWTSRNPLDLLVAAWAGWVFLSGFAHDPPDHNPITIRLSQIYGIGGSYLYARAFIRTPDDFLRYAKGLAIIVVPLAVFTLFEKFAQQNLYGLISSGNPGIIIRGERVRATGPFAHPILLGTFAATSLVLVGALYRTQKRWFYLGAAACTVIVFSSASSGPIVTTASGLMGLLLWRWRLSVGRIRAVVILMFVALHLVMQAPVWYLMARIDLAGGSTGWHRAELITAAIRHFDEWWFTGTDHTRHWIAYGVEWSGYHTDITNYYLVMGVMGGFPLLLLFGAILIKSFQLLGRQMRALRRAKDPHEFTLWCVGAALFAHCFTFLSIGYFDQSYAPLFLMIGAIPGLCAVARKRLVLTPSEVARETPGATTSSDSSPEESSGHAMGR
jgi:hypothetical protein